MKKYLLGLLLFFVSCGIGKTYLYELDFTEDKDRKSGNIFNVFVHDKKGNAFDGTAWSSDGKTLSIEVNNGILVCLKMYIMKMGKWLHIAHYNNVPIMIKMGM